MTHATSTNIYFDRLPEELVIQIFTLSLHQRFPGQSLRQLRIGCRAWKAIVDRTSTLWSLIKAGDSLRHIRDAVVKSGDAPLNLTLTTYDADVIEANDFLEAA
ncbi:hypothetical protein FRB90_011422, partial [Tulasnella sp. 427]